MNAGIPYKIAVLVYVFDDAGRLLLLHRKRPPNRDLYSPIGGKLEQQIGESPYACALREIEEEIGVRLSHSDIRLLGIVSKRTFAGTGASTGEEADAGAPAHQKSQIQNPKSDTSHWLMFCFEVLPRQNFPARQIDEGRLEWVNPADMAQLDIPRTDRDIIWPLVCRHARALPPPAASDDYFSVHIDCTDADRFIVTHEHPDPSHPQASPR